MTAVVNIRLIGENSKAARLGTLCFTAYIILQGHALSSQASFRALQQHLRVSGRPRRPRGAGFMSFEGPRFVIGRYVQFSTMADMCCTRLYG